LTGVVPASAVPAGGGADGAGGVGRAAEVAQAAQRTSGRARSTAER
jgi:hypothetical protein